jgi:hypothetical protein
MSGPWRTAKVFISSTFRDMHTERDHLVKVVFPELRERLLPYRVYLDDIDLRWGITEEESRKDRVLDLCLQQIDECRPFFIGILGERYGWVPATLLSREAARRFEQYGQTAGRRRAQGAPAATLGWVVHPLRGKETPGLPPEKMFAAVVARPAPNIA